MRHPPKRHPDEPRRGGLLTRGLLFCALAATMFLACASGGGKGGGDAVSQESTAAGPGFGSGASGSGGGPGFSSGPSGGSTPSVATAHISGQVFAPEGTIPISGALVYATQGEVAPIPQEVFCDRCVDLPSGSAHTFSGADGTFSLGVYGTGNWAIVIRKGSFRRVHLVTVENGVDQQLDALSTTLPSVRDELTGAEIPKMAVATVEVGMWDEISNSLAKLGLGQIDGYGSLMPGTESFHIFGPQSAYGEAGDLLSDYATLSQYHIVFFPCAMDWADSYLTDPQVLSNLRDYMAAGGRIYATDYSYDILRRAVDDPIQWMYDDGSFGAAETSEYDAAATVVDADMAAWLAAQGVGSFTLEANFTVVDSVQSYQALDEDGNSATMTPKVWVSAAVPDVGEHPATISYQYGCGRALFSTYHTEPWGLQTVTPQERALLYIILEVGVCIGDLTPPK